MGSARIGLSGVSGGFPCRVWEDRKVVHRARMCVGQADGVREVHPEMLKDCKVLVLSLGSRLKLT